VADFAVIWRMRLPNCNTRLCAIGAISPDNPLRLSAGLENVEKRCFDMIRSLAVGERISAAPERRPPVNSSALSKARCSRRLDMRLATGACKVSAVIPCLNEEESIGSVVREVLAQGVDEVIVVDNGSSDRTTDCARTAGARVVQEPVRGYGRACAAGLQ
jgi:hypothetical protein